MPRGYLKRRARSVGGNVARGGSSRKQVPRTWKEDRVRFPPRYRSLQIAEYMDEVAAFSFYDDDDFELDCESDEEWVMDRCTPPTPAELPCSVASVSDTGAIVSGAKENHEHHVGGVINDDSSIFTGVVVSAVDSFSFIEREDIDDDASFSAWDFVSVDGTNAKTIIETKQGFCSFVDIAEENSLLGPQQAVHPTSEQCAICLEAKTDILNLIQKCSHPRACFDCLRTHYVKYEMENATSFPLRCFWPGCNRVLRDTQIRRLVKKDSEMQRFYRQQRLARETRHMDVKRVLDRGIQKRKQDRQANNFKATQSCGQCNETVVVYPCRSSEYMCSHCRYIGKVDVITAEEVRSIVASVGENLVFCPSCHNAIIKNGGCNHMVCLCGATFDFGVAHRELSHSGTARPRLI